MHNDNNNNKRLAFFKIKINSRTLLLYIYRQTVYNDSTPRLYVYCVYFQPRALPFYLFFFLAHTTFGHVCDFRLFFLRFFFAFGKNRRTNRGVGHTYIYILQRCWIEKYRCESSLYNIILLYISNSKGEKNRPGRWTTLHAAVYVQHE